MNGCDYMNKIKNPYSFFQLFVTYHKKHFYKIIVPWIILSLIVLGTSFNKSISDNNAFEWDNFLLGSLVFFGVLYFIYMIFFIAYYFASIYPHKYLLILKSPLFLKSIFIGILLLVGLPVVFGKHNLSIDNYENILSLSWSIFGISVTFALVTYFLVTDKLSSEKQVVSKLGKIDHNASVILSLSTFFMLSVNVFLLSWSSLDVFLLSREVSRFNEIISQTTFWFSINVVASTTYDFIAHLKTKKREIEFASAEIALEKNEIEESSKEFTRIRKQMKQLTLTYKIMIKKRTRVDTILKQSTKIASYLEEFASKLTDSPQSIDVQQAKVFVKEYKKYVQLRNEATAILADIERFQIEVDKFQETIAPQSKV